MRRIPQAFVGIIIAVLLGSFDDIQAEEQAGKSKELCNRKSLQFIIGANLCAAGLKVTTAKAEIKHEYDIAKFSGGGMIDKKYVYNRQTAISTALSEAEEMRVFARQEKVKPLPCSAKGVLVMAKCLKNPALDGCSEEHIREWMSLIYNVKAYDPDDDNDESEFAQPLSHYEGDEKDKSPFCIK